MTKSDLDKAKLPDTPGVYYFLGAKKEILYLGKATSLRNRVQSYFTDDIADKRSKLIENMVIEAKTVEFTETDSVLEALILEANLIRTHKPKFNTIGKDDKSYNHLVITKEEYPRVLVVRAKDLTEKYHDDDLLAEFGPYPSGALFKEALRIIRKLFKYYDTKVPVGKEKTKIARSKIDFNTQIGLYPESTDKGEYLRTIKHIRLFFEGKKREIIADLEKNMHEFAKDEKFEEADSLKKKIYALEHINDISLLKNEFKTYRDETNVRLEAYDVAHLAGESMVGVMTVVEGNTASTDEYRKFKVQSVSGPNDTAALREILSRRLNHAEWELPQVIVVDGSTAQKNAAERVLKQRSLHIPVVGVVKDEKHKPVRIIGQKKLIDKHKDSILLANAESHRFAISYHRKDKRKNLLK